MDVQDPGDKRRAEWGKKKHEMHVFLLLLFFLILGDKLFVSCSSFRNNQENPILPPHARAGTRTDAHVHTRDYSEGFFLFVCTLDIRLK